MQDMKNLRERSGQSALQAAKRVVRACIFVGFCLMNSVMPGSDVPGVPHARTCMPKTAANQREGMVYIQPVEYK